MKGEKDTETGKEKENKQRINTGDKQAEWQTIEKGNRNKGKQLETQNTKEKTIENT